MVSPPASSEETSLFALLLSALLTLLAPVALAQDARPAAPNTKDDAGQAAPDSQRGPWIHVRVTDGQGEESANVNLPVALIALVLKMGDVQAQLDRGLAQRDLSLVDLRQTWGGLTDAGDADIVVTEDADETVRVRVENGSLHVRVTDRATGALRTEASMPGRVVDALLGGDGERLDISGAIRRLAEKGAGDVVVARDGATSLRVWLD